MRQPHMLGLDIASLTGWSHSNGTSGVWHLKQADSDHTGHLMVRLRKHLRKIHEEDGVDVVGFEDTSRIVRHTAAAVHQAMLRGAMLEFCAMFNVPYVGFTPTEIKSRAVGSGKASKDQMKRACWSLLGKNPSDDNEADALWVLECTKGQVRSWPAWMKPWEKEIAE